MGGFAPAIHVFVAAMVFKTWMPGTSPGMTSAAQLALRARAAERCAFFAARCVVRRAREWVARLPDALPFRLCWSASITLTTLSGLSSRSADLTRLPAALRLTDVFQAPSD